SADRTQCHVVGVEGGQRQYSYLGVAVRQLGDRLDAAHHGHPQIHQHHRRRRLGDPVEAFLTVAGLAEDGDAVSGSDHQGQGGSDQRIVVDDQDVNVHAVHGIRASTTKRPGPSVTDQVPSSSSTRSCSPTWPYPPPWTAGPATG